MSKLQLLPCAVYVFSGEMPPRSKTKLPVEWISCDTPCGCYMSNKRDLDIHRSQACSVASPFRVDGGLPVSAARHAFILNGALLATVTLLQKGMLILSIESTLYLLIFLVSMTRTLD